MAVATSTALLIGAAVTVAGTIASIATRPGTPSVPGVPDTPLSDPARTQAELDTEARRERVKRARLNQIGTGVGTTPLGLAPTGTQRTLPKLTGE